MKPRIVKLKNARGRITGYKGMIGPIESSGTTPVLASTGCEHRTLDALERLDRGTLIGEWRGHVYVISPTVNGWSYWIDTFSRDGYAVSLPGNTEREAAQDAAVFHLAQNLWGPEVDDAAFLTGLPRAVASELNLWIGFQRTYARAREAGMNDVEAHRTACENRSPAVSS